LPIYGNCEAKLTLNAISALIRFINIAELLRAISLVDRCF